MPLMNSATGFRAHRMLEVVVKGITLKNIFFPAKVIRPKAPPPQGTYGRGEREKTATESKAKSQKKSIAPRPARILGEIPRDASFQKKDQKETNRSFR
ncbi:MAG: hypothetical protein HZC18_02010 [Candidatus Omnitrophica bacterium]|nr:hypothetical protein [Candidatus Omnitrophota bacterium]